MQQENGKAATLMLLSLKPLSGYCSVDVKAPQSWSQYIFHSAHTLLPLSEQVTAEVNSFPLFPWRGPFLCSGKQTETSSEPWNAPQDKSSASSSEDADPAVDMAPPKVVSI